MRAPRCVRPLEPLVLPAGVDATDALRPFAGALVVTSDSPAPAFARASTPPDVVAALERHAALVTDLRVDRYPARRDFEPFGLNYMPFSGLRSLLRPGPRLRFWRIAAP